MNKRIEEDILLLPNKPGVYQMKNELGEIIYIGKAKNLKNRVSQYFLRPQNGKTQAMVSHVDHFEIIITRSEKEAFILEMNLIQKYLPRYNILLKDDKHYPYIALHKTKDPYISIARNLKDKKCEYFGPYPLSSNAYQMVDLLNKLFPLRKCKNVPKIPCLYYHLNQCLAPCINKINPDKYDKIFDSIRKFLKGDNKEVLLKIKEKILYYSNNLDFENANEYKKYLEAINHINDRQNVELFDKIDRDIFAYTLDKNYLSLSIFIYREGILIGKRNFTYELVGETIEFVSNLICQYYLYNKLPDEIVIGNKEVSEKISSILEVKTIVPTKGKLFELLTLAKVNSKEDLDEHFVSARLNDNNLELLENLGNLLNIKTPYNIELFDNSHLQGTNAIGAMVSFVNGEPCKKNYRKFNIESYNSKDDLMMMKEVLFRRYKRLKEENLTFPDLILIDGGRGQLNSAIEALKELDIKGQIIMSLAKRFEEIYLPNREEPVQLKDNDPARLFLQKVRDETHRWVNTSHGKKRSREMLKSELENIKGLGSKGMEKLYSHFINIENIKNASFESIRNIPGISYKVANNIYDYFHK